MSVTGRIFEIQHLALYDGPGLRTVIYIKGCPLRCLWCHNPEGQSAESELLFHAEKCLSCGGCSEVCPVGARDAADGFYPDRTICTGCGKCAQRCMTGASVLAGKTVGVDETMQEILADRPFYREGGGVTLSGGEPLAQPDFAISLLRAAKEAGISTCVETCGYASGETVRQVAEVTDLWYFDIKETDPARHIALTGVDNARILENLRLLDALGARVILRVPVIPGCNFRAEFFTSVARLAESLSSVGAVELEPYHPLGLAKYESLGIKAPFTSRDFLDPAALADAASRMREVTRKTIRLSNGENV